MTKTIVVPLDRSEFAECALPVAKMLAHQLDARVHLVSVIEVSPDYAGWLDQQTEDEPRTQEHEDMEAYLKGVAERLDAPGVSTELLFGVDPAVEIDSLVSQLDDGLLVLTSHGRSGIKRMVLGSKTTRMVQLADYPLIVVPADCSRFGYPESISRILVALDGSSFAEYARHVTLDVFPSGDLSIHLLRVVDPVEAADTDIEERAAEYLGNMAEKLSAEGRTVTWAVDMAYPADVANRIVTNAHVTQCDLISMATHGRTGFSRWYYGSVADGVLRTSTKPVMVVRPSEDVIARAPESRSRRQRTN